MSTRTLRNRGTTSNADSSSPVNKSPKSRKSSKKLKGGLRLTNRQAVDITTVDDSNEDNEDAEDEGDPTDTDDSDDIAPSGRPNRRSGHKTGLSISMSNTSIGYGNRKRTWSNREREEEDEMSRPQKITRAKSTSSSDEEEEEEEEGDDEQSDAGYEGVEFISESSDEDTDHEEMLIVSGGLAREEMDLESDDDASEEWNGFEDNDTTSQRPGELVQSLLNEFESRDQSNDVEERNRSARKVRFLDQVTNMVVTDSSDEEDEEADQSLFPDIFMDQSELASSIRRADLQNDEEFDDTYWENPDTGISGMAQQTEQTLDSILGEEDLSDFSSDGDTTDEEPLLPFLVRPSKLVKNPTPPKSPRTPKRQIRRGTATPGSSSRKLPAMGTFEVNPDKDHMHADEDKKKIIIHPPSNPQSRQAATFDESLVNSASNSPTRITFPTEIGISNELAAALLVVEGSGQNLISSPQNPINAAQPLNNASDWLPRDLLLHMPLMADVTENLGDMDEFLDFSQNEEGSEANEEEAVNGGDDENLLLSMNASAFKRNQERVLGTSQSIRATYEAVKSGRLSSAEQPISPLRKQKPGTGLSAIAATIKARSER